MAEATTEEVKGSTILTETVKEETKAEEKLFPTAEQKAEQDKAAQETAAKAAEQTAADKAKADADAASKTKTETKTETTTTETKVPTEQEKAEAEKARLAAQKDYTLSLPENSPLSSEELAAIQKEAKDAGLTKEKAEQMLTSKDQTARAAQTRLQEQQAKAFAETKSQWRATVEKDPEMGGDKFNETVALSSRAFKTLASPELQIWAEKTGLGSYPEFVRLMAKVGKMMGEDRLIRGSIDAPTEKKPKEEVLYGKTTPNK